MKDHLKDLTKLSQEEIDWMVEDYICRSEVDDDPHGMLGKLFDENNRRYEEAHSSKSYFQTPSNSTKK